jgi:hypothetical protein
MARGKAIRAVVVLDMKTFTVEHVYIGCSRKEAATAFIKSLQSSVDVSYSDMRDEVADALQRYHFVDCEPSRVSMRRPA